MADVSDLTDPGTLRFEDGTVINLDDATPSDFGAGLIADMVAATVRSTGPGGEQVFKQAQAMLGMYVKQLEQAYPLVALRQQSLADIELAATELQGMSDTEQVIEALNQMAERANAAVLVADTVQGQVGALLRIASCCVLQAEAVIRMAEQDAAAAKAAQDIAAQEASDRDILATDQEGAE